MGEERGSFGNRRGETACVVEVRMGVDDETDRLVRNGLLGCSHHRHAASVVLTAFDDEDVIPHVDGQRRIVPADLERSFAKLFDRRCRCCGRCTARRRRHLPEVRRRAQLQADHLPEPRPPEDHPPEVRRRAQLPQADHLPVPHPPEDHPLPRHHDQPPEVEE